jgi:hypothetical protein
MTTAHLPLHEHQHKPLAQFSLFPSRTSHLNEINELHVQHRVYQHRKFQVRDHVSRAMAKSKNELPQYSMRT